jgi:hypothetical protein
MDPSGFFKSLESLLKTMGLAGLIGGTSFLLFAPDDWLKTVRVLSLRDNHGEWVGLAFLVGVSTLVSVSWTGCTSWWKSRGEKAAQQVKQKAERAQVEQFVALWHTLEDAERAILLKVHSEGGSAGDLLQRFDFIHGPDAAKTARFLNLGLVEYVAGYYERSLHLTMWASRGMEEVVHQIQKKHRKKQIESGRSPSV